MKSKKKQKTWEIKKVVTRMELDNVDRAMVYFSIFMVLLFLFFIGLIYASPIYKDAFWFGIFIVMLLPFFVLVFLIAWIFMRKVRYVAVEVKNSEGLER